MKIDGERGNFENVRNKNLELMKKLIYLNGQKLDEIKDKKKELEGLMKVEGRKMFKIYANAGKVDKLPKVFMKAEEEEFACMGVTPKAIFEDFSHNIVTTLYPNNFADYTWFTYGLRDLPHFDHQAKAEIQLVRYYTHEESMGRGSCCEGDNGVIAGRIKAIDGEVFSVEAEDGQQYVVHQAICSRIYNVGYQQANWIVYKQVSYEGTDYIIEAVLYKAEPVTPAKDSDGGSNGYGY